MMRKLMMAFALGLLVTTVGACNPKLTTTPISDLQTIEAIAGTATVLSSIPDQTPTPGDAPLQTCAISSGDPVLPDLASDATLPGMLLDYLNRGGDPAVLQNHLQAQAWLPTAGLPFAWADFTGNAYLDLALATTHLDPQTNLPSGSLILLACNGEQYSLNIASSPAPELPVIYSSQDLNADGRADLLVGYTTCGAHTCALRLEALLWNGVTLENRLQGISPDLPSPSVEVRPSAALKPHEIAITAGGIASAGAGPYRLRTRVWSWDSASRSFLVSDEYQHPATFRIHVVHDADDAFLTGDLDTALSLYNRVVEDDSLQDWGELEIRRQQLCAYAMYRRVLTHLRAGEIEPALAAYRILDAMYAEMAPGRASAELAGVLWETFEDQGDLNAACNYVQDFAFQNSKRILDPLDYGYANPHYMTADICPNIP